MEIEPTVFYLIRHGEGEHNVRNILSSYDDSEQFGLTETGQRQIGVCAEELGCEKVDIIFASPLRRTRETAEIIASATGAEIVTDDRLRETDFGIHSGRQASEFWAKYPDPLTRLEGEEKEGLEGVRAMRVRLESFLADVVEEYRGKHIAIVSHGDPIGVFHGILEGMALETSVVSRSPRVGSWMKVMKK